jgi:ATP-dependent Zn protease
LCSNPTKLSFEWLFNLKLTNGSFLVKYSDDSMNENREFKVDYRYFIEYEFQVLIATCIVKNGSFLAVDSYAFLPIREDATTSNEATDGSTIYYLSSNTTITTTTTTAATTATTSTSTETTNSTSTQKIDNSTISLKISYVAGIAVGSFLFGIILSILIIILIIKKFYNFQRKGQYKIEKSK